MTFPAKLLRLQLGGSLYGTDQWSIGFHFTTAGAVAPASSLKGITEAFYTSLPSSDRHASAKLGFIKFNEIDHLTGKYVNTGATNAAYWAPEFSSVGNAGLLPQGCLCATLTTAKARGRGHSGRVYLPAYQAVNTTGHVDSGRCETFANTVATYLNAVTLFDPGLTAVVWSKVGNSVEPIIGVKVGDVVDTQRRRRGQIKESYWPSAIVVD